MVKNNGEKKEKDKEYFLSTKDENGDFLIYQSETYKISEIDLINLIKICLIESRSKAIGNKLLEVYRDSTHKRKEITQQRLNIIGVKDVKKDPIRTKVSKTR